MPEGNVFKYGDHIDTDVIIPARYLNTPSPDNLRQHCMEDLDPDFTGRVRSGDLVVAGWNFGCGSSREHAPLALRYAGVSCVIAASFARIFYRNAINIGLPILECPEAAMALQNDDRVQVVFDTGEIRNLTTGAVYQAEAFPSFIQDMIACGGRLAYLKSRQKEAH